jgi:hypothetical protein
VPPQANGRALAKLQLREPEHEIWLKVGDGP